MRETAKQQGVRLVGEMRPCVGCVRRRAGGHRCRSVAPARRYRSAKSTSTSRARSLMRWKAALGILGTEPPELSIKRNPPFPLPPSRNPHGSVRRESGISPVIGGGSQRTRGDSEEEVRLEEGELGGVPGKATTTAAGGDGDTGDVATLAAIGRGVTTAATADADDAVAPCTWNEWEPTNASIVAEGSSTTAPAAGVALSRGCRERGSATETSVVL
ncbi:unnamed protein product [Ectocarpus sp. CCAP 1310/34]|nr:unnamed protein product [Ectocarpus sp. CCAP 1310/34]